ncbi:phosphotransferase [Metabacillus idriensis]|uniref:phosphotransferase n=1 Tax=Metabacillus idriensis TaxID=324768 RepID=UPI003D269A54
MVNPWSPERSVSESLAVKLITNDFPQLHPVRARLLGKGFDNTVFEVNGRYVFRFPRRQIAVDLLQTEKRLLPILPDMGIAIPVPVFSSSPGLDYQWPYLGYSFLQGKTPAYLTEKQRTDMAIPLARFLKTLHAFPVDQALGAGVKNDTLGRLDMDKRIPMIRETAEKLCMLRPESPHVIQLKSYADQLEPIEHESAKCLVHGDLHIRNILVAENGSLSGIIDWGDTHIGDPAVDLSAVYSLLPPEARLLFFEEYGRINETAAALARFKAVYTLAVLLIYGIDLKDWILVKSAEEAIEIALI